MLTTMPGTILRRISRWFIAVGLAAAVAGAAGIAWAHPHAWVKSRSEVIFKHGAIVALRHTWIFDAYYTQGATEGLDKNGDGTLSSAELAELTKINIDGLKEFDYFTEASLGGHPVKFGTPTDASMKMAEVDNDDAPESGMMIINDSNGPAPAPQAKSKTGKQKLLTLSFTLPLAEPVPPHTKGFTFTVRDTSIFIWFELATKSPVRLVGAPAGCTQTLGHPEMTPEQKRLQAAFGGGGDLTAMASPPNTVRLSCK
ncbi:MAG: DUF1007 family protein [Hyphomicrobiaceae bacterium]